jgi:uncharacterized RDD family membrane protein YckC
LSLADRQANTRKAPLMAYGNPPGTPPYGGGGQPPYQGGQPPYQGGQPPYQGGQPPYQGGQPPYQGGQPSYQGGPGPYQGGPGPYQGGPQYGGIPASQYAPWIHRVGAALVDWVPPWAIIFIGALTGSRPIYFLFLVVGIGVWIYNRFVLGGRGQTWGKRVVGIRLISEETGQPVGTLNAFLRDICHIVDGAICDIGYLFPLWDAKRQTLADKIMRTVVIPA